jgi:hypothetical protein
MRNEKYVKNKNDFNTLALGTSWDKCAKLYRECEKCPYLLYL